jgi:hypothetical protein
MANRTTAMVACTLVLAGSAELAQAEGLFRRIPEPGEWCRYGTVLLVSLEGFDTAQPELTGTFAIRALDVIEHEGQPHQWVELEMVVNPPVVNGETVEGDTIIYKYLVRRDQLTAEGDPAGHIVRAWKKVREAKPSVADWKNAGPDEPGALLLRMAFGGSLAEAKPVTSRKSLTVGEREISSDKGTTGKLTPFKAPDGVEFSGELSFWQDEKTAFGVLAAEYLFQVRPLNEKVPLPPGEFAIQLDWQESGQGAVSKLPEQK